MMVYLKNGGYNDYGLGEHQRQEVIEHNIKPDLRIENFLLGIIFPYFLQHKTTGMGDKTTHHKFQRAPMILQRGEENRNLSSAYFGGFYNSQ